MMRVTITGGRGFLGRNLAERLRERDDCKLSLLGRGDNPQFVNDSLLHADLIFHLAGTSRAHDAHDFERDNSQLTAELCALLKEHGRSPKIVFSSSIRVALNTDYGQSKLRAEDELQRFADQTGANVRIYRLNNLFGKGARPNHNSVVATFCHNAARELPLDVHDPDRVLHLSVVDDAMDSFLDELGAAPDARNAKAQIPVYPIRLANLAEKIIELHRLTATLTMPDFSDPFTRALYSTYLSYVPLPNLLQPLTTHQNARGILFELFKEQHFGQILILRIPPGATRGNHSHHSKTERFIVLEGDGLIQLRSQISEIQSFRVRGDSPETIDIPPGVAHSISNVGAGGLVALVWSSSIFDPTNPDTVPIAIEAAAAVPAECRSHV